MVEANKNRKVSGQKAEQKVAWIAKKDEAAQRPPESLVMATNFGDDSDGKDVEKDMEAPSHASPSYPPSHQYIDWDSAPGITGLIARFVRNRYTLMYGIFIIIVLLLIGIVFLLSPDERCIENGGRGQMQVCTQSEHDWELSFLEASKNKDAIGFARVDAANAFSKLSETYFGASAEKDDTRSAASDRVNLRFVFWHENEEKFKERSIFTPKKVKDMCELESFLLSHPFYPSFCVLDDAKACAPQPFSIASRFYDADKLDPANGGCAELPAAVVAAKAAELAAGFAVSSSFFAAVDAVTGGYTNRTRSLLQLGTPLEGYLDDDDRSAEQRDLYLMMFSDTKCGGFGDAAECEQDYKCKNVKAYCQAANIQEDAVVKGVETLLFERYDLQGFPRSGQFEGAFVSPYDDAEPEESYEGEPGMEVRFWSIPLQQEEFGRVVNGDLNFAILSVVVVGAYVWFHTQSLFIAVLSMFQIVVSLPVGFFFYYNVFQIKYYASVNILAIYLALGIGADSVFVFSDCWNQSRSNPGIHTILGRLSFSIHRTATSCFNTTLTTIMSFVATSFTPVIPIYCFAVFAAVVLAVNYVFVCVITPVVIMLHHVFFSDLGGVCCYWSKRAPAILAPKEPTVTHDLEEIRAKDFVYTYLFPCSRCPGPAQLELPVAAGPDSEAGGTASFGNDSPAGEGEATPPAQALSVSERFFHNQFFGWISYQVGGLKIGSLLPVAVCVGYAVFMATQAFRLTPPNKEEEWFPSSHMFNADLSDRLFNNWKGATDNGYMNMAFVFGVETVDRSSHNRLFPNADRGEVVYDDSFSLADEDAQRFFIRACEELEATTCAAAACQPDGNLVLRGQAVTCVVRDLLEYYKATTGAAAATTAIPQAAFTQTALSFFTDVSAPETTVAVLQERIQRYQSVIGFNGEQAPPALAVQWAAISFRSSVALPMTNSESRELHKLYEDIVAGLREEAPAGMQALFQTDTQASGTGWTWKDVEDALVQNLLTGFAICFPVAFVVLVFATGNLVIATFATTSIVFIVAGVLGAAKLYYDWDLGIAESIAGVIVIGFSVDYTVHLGHMYKEGEGSRQDKTLHALTYMGTTVIGGGLTTLSAGLVLFLCTLTFFTKMALLLVWTIVLSIIYALFFFMPLCFLFGPEDKFGEVPSISTIVAALKGGSKVAPS